MLKLQKQTLKPSPAKDEGRPREESRGGESGDGPSEVTANDSTGQESPHSKASGD